MEKQETREETIERLGCKPEDLGDYTKGATHQSIKAVAAVGLGIVAICGVWIAIDLYRSYKNPPK